MSVSCTSLVSSTQVSHHEDQEESKLSSSLLCSSIDVSSICTEDQEFTASDIFDLSSLSADSVPTESNNPNDPQAKKTAQEKLLAAISESYSLDQGMFSSLFDWAGRALNTVFSYWSGDLVSTQPSLPSELPSLILPVLRQNQFCCCEFL